MIAVLGGQMHWRRTAKSTDEPSGCAYLGLLSFIACLLGSALAAPVFIGTTYSQFLLGSGWENGANFLLSVMFVSFVGAFFAIPIGLLLGIPLLAACRPFLHYTALAAPVFALSGLLTGLAVKHFSEVEFGSAELVFGACIGGMHPLVYGRASGVAWSKICIASLLSTIIVPAVAYAGEDVLNAIGSRHEFEERCADIYGSMAVVRDRADMEQQDPAYPYAGKWLNQRKWRSLYAREDVTLLDETQVLIARDYAYVPGGFTGWITGGRRVERHCLTDKTGVDADFLRGQGFGVRPNLRDLAD
ncbi:MULTISPECIES: hypothetical protein [unclassified Sphingobium]|uniref:hypothetical protein n=1 Tax=unclassified Sphingobium TaxID=2611147 RepID=UPI00222472D6|nr:MULTISPECIES: hypothetical protein [unclassified Sphingobium]MCW2395502.1 hypothetical protein [Sphingobium sp. B8D3B]MCW2419017.1 hypothetical protein [Sphingobium sp. B8D3C]